MTQNSAPSAAENALAQTALDHVRRIFKGNGIKADSIQILSQNIATHSVNAGTYLELKPLTSEKTVGGRSIIGQPVNSREEASAKINQIMSQTIHDATMKAQIANILLQRSDKGFGLHQQAVPIGFLGREFSWHEPCSTCQGRGQSTCPQCQGRKTQTCNKCSGRGLTICPQCRSTGMIQGVKCSRCQGQRYVPCDQCRRSGFMTCRTCNGMGTGKCTTCGGAGAKTHVMTLAPQALTYFEFDAKSLPKGAADVIETDAIKLVEGGKVKIQGRMADDKENALGASYEVSFPYGEIVFSVGKKEVKANVFGHKGDITLFPHLLDKLIAPAVEDLEDAAKNIGSVADAIQKATRYRVIAQGFLYASKASVEKATFALLKIYDIGLSQSMAEKIVSLADTTTSRITKKPRYYGLGIGLGATAIFNALYYLLPVRSTIASYLPDARMDIILDVPPIVIGGMITTIAIQMSAAKAMQSALGKLIEKGLKGTSSIKTRDSGWIGWVGAVILTLLFAALSIPSPYWYSLIMDG